MAAPRILAYVEDPGAANMVLGLADALAVQGAELHLRAGGTAKTYLDDRQTPSIAAGLPADPASWIDEAAADAVVVGTSEAPETPAFHLLAEARRQGLPTAALIDGPGAPDRRLRGRTNDPLAHAPDWLIVPDRIVAEPYVALGFDKARIRVCGAPTLDRARTAGAAFRAQGRKTLRRACFPGAKREQPVVLFLAELSDGLEPAQFRRGPDYTLAGRGDCDGRTEIVLEEVLDGLKAAAPEAHVVLRLHPKTPRADFAAYLDEVDAVSDGGDPLPQVFAADLVIGLSTALLYEAAIMGGNVLSVLPRAAEISWLPSNLLGLTPYETTRSGLRAALARAVADPENFMPLRPPAAALFDAAGRIARVLKALATGRTPPADAGLYRPPVLTTPRLVLEPFPPELLTERYVGWLNDPEVVRFSEQRHITHTIDSCRDFIAGFRDTPNALWAIRENTRERRHIGNISTEVDPEAATGDIRILIGERDAWGTGLGAEAWMAVMGHLFDDLDLAEVTAGTLEGNTGMLRIMAKSGMTETRREPGPTPVDGRPMAAVYARRLARDWREKQ